MNNFGTLAEMPGELTAGDVVTLSLVSLSADYPAGEFTLLLSLKMAAEAAITVEFADADGIQTGALDLSGAAAGSYLWSIRATSAGDGSTLIIGRGFLAVRPDASAEGDVRGHSEKMLASIEALLEGRAGKDVNQYSIAGRSLTKMTVSELMKWRDHYRAEVRNLRNQALPNRGRRLSVVRFVNNV